VEKQTYVDVNIFVYWLGAHPEFGERSRVWIEGIREAGSGTFLTSAITIYELCIIISGLTGRSLRDQELIKGIVEPMNALRGLKINAMHDEDLKNAFHLMNDYNLDYEDALHLSNALRSGADKILTNDKDFNGTPLRPVF